MLDSIIKNAAPEIISAVKEKFGLNQEQASKAVDTTKESLEDSVTKEASSGNMDGLLSVFNGGGDTTGNRTFQTLIDNLSSDYMKKLGLSESLAKKISTYVLPLILSKFTSRTGGDMDKGDLIKMLGLGNVLKGGLGKIFK